MVVENFDAVSSVVTDEDLHLVVDGDTIGKFEMLRAGEFSENISNHVEYNDPHNLTLHYYDPFFVVYSDASWMLQDIHTKLTNELTVLGEYLNLK